VKTVTGSLTGLGGRFNVIGSILRPFIAIIEGVFVGLKKLGQLIGIVDSDEEARLKNNLDLQEKQMTQINEKYDLESRLLKASGQDTKKVEDDKLKAQNANFKGQHPTQKPVALFEYLIKTYTNEGDLVLDNCAGSGTTGVACKNLNRNFILIEKEPEYIDIINKRLA